MDDKGIDWFVEEPPAQPARRRRKFVFIVTTLASAAGLALVAFAIANREKAPVPAPVAASAPAAGISTAKTPRAPISELVMPLPWLALRLGGLSSLPAPAKVVVVVTPRAARVTLNGIRPITTETAVAIPPGTHTLVATHPGFESTTLPIDAKPGELLVRSIALRRSPPAKLFVTVHERGEPSWAHVFVDDQARGATPATIALPAGSHELRFEKAGRKSFSVTVALKAGQQKRLSIDLENR